MRKLILFIALLIGTCFTWSCHQMESARNTRANPIQQTDETIAESDPTEQAPEEPEVPVEEPEIPVEEPPEEEPRIIKEFTFPSCGELNALWKTRYHAQLKVNWPLRDIACSGPSKDRVFAEAAYILEKTVFRLDALPAGVMAPPSDMLKFVTQKYRQLRIGPNDFPSTDVANKIVYFYAGIENENGFSAVGNLIHEARHADGNIYLHVPCLDGPYKGQHMCDVGLGDSFYEGGTHRIATLYFAWGAARSNWPQAWKTSVRDLTRYIILNRINAPQAARQAWVDKYLKDW